MQKCTFLSVHVKGITNLRWSALKHCIQNDLHICNSYLASGWDGRRGKERRREKPAKDRFFVSNTLNVCCQLIKSWMRTCCVLFYVHTRKRQVVFFFSLKTRWNLLPRKVRNVQTVEKKKTRRAAGGHLCHQLQRVIVGEVKIKACGRRLAPQPRLNSLPCPWWCCWPV